MKKLLLIAAVAVSGFTSANAQDINWGAKAGLNFASIAGDGTEELSGKTGFHIGFLAEMILTDQFAIQPEILYSTQGAKGEISESEFNAKQQLNLNYVNIPIMAKYYIMDGLNLELGPQVGFLVTAEANYEETAEGESFSESEDIKDELNSTDLALAGGLGYKMGKIFLNARYGVGLSNILKNEGEDNFSQKNTVFQLSVGYMF